MPRITLSHARQSAHDLLAALCSFKRILADARQSKTYDSLQASDAIWRAACDEHRREWKKWLKHLNAVSDEVTQAKYGGIDPRVYRRSICLALAYLGRQVLPYLNESLLTLQDALESRLNGVGPEWWWELVREFDAAERRQQIAPPPGKQEDPIALGLALLAQGHDLPTIAEKLGIGKSIYRSKMYRPILKRAEALDIYKPRARKTRRRRGSKV